MEKRVIQDVRNELITSSASPQPVATAEYEGRLVWGTPLCYPGIMATPQSSLHVAAVGQREHGTMALVVAMAVRFGYAGPLEAAAGWESASRRVRLFDGRHRVCDDDGRRAATDALVVVVDGDDGPQVGTRDEIRAARQVGIEYVVVFLTRASALVDQPAQMDIVESNTRRLLAEFGYPADDIPIVRGDAVASAGECLDELRTALDRIPIPTRPLLHPDGRKACVHVGVFGAAGHGKTSLLAAVVTRLAQLNRPLNGVTPRVRPGEVGRVTYCETDSQWAVFSEQPTDLARILNPDWRDAEVMQSPTAMDAAVLVVAADEAMTWWTSQYALLARHLGVPLLAVFLNRCDRVQESDDLDAIERGLRTLLDKCGWRGCDVPVIRGSALAAEAYAGSDERATACVDDLLDVLARRVRVAEPDKPFLLAVASTLRLSGGRDTVVFGRVERGRVESGDEVELVGLGKEPRRATARSVVSALHHTEGGLPGDTVTLHLPGVAQGEIRVGQVLASPRTVTVHRSFEATVYLPPVTDPRAALFSGHEAEFCFRTAVVSGRYELPAGVLAALAGNTVAMTVTLPSGTPVVMEPGQRFLMLRTGSGGLGVGVVTRVLD